MGKWTKGPWIVKEFPPEDHDGEEALTAIIAYGEDGPILAEVNRWTYHGEPATEESVANARLIAAAPSLAEALQACVKQMDDWGLGGPAVLQARAALRDAGVEG